MPGSPSCAEPRCLGKPLSPCQACVPGWFPVLPSPSGFVLVSGCHGYRSQLLWQKRTPPGQGSASPHQPLLRPISSAWSARGLDQRERNYVSRREQVSRRSWGRIDQLYLTKKDNFYYQTKYARGKTLPRSAPTWEAEVPITLQPPVLPNSYRLTWGERLRSLKCLV